MTEYVGLTKIPAEMKPWNLKLVKAVPSKYGVLELVEVRQNDKVEQQHVGRVLGPDGQPYQGIGEDAIFIFGFGHGDGDDLNKWLPDESYWHVNQPAVLNGKGGHMVNGQWEHTFHGGGEDAWPWLLVRGADGSKILKYPADILKNCSSVNVGGGGTFEHTGVVATWQLRVREALSE